ncbi:hypothetical protein FRB91_003384 [Serendipita sp. 411]|nr:hypothetical protein FRB91_003384 [Serendipita sp. 411]
MATVAQPKRPRESDDEDIDANDQLVDPALVHADAAKRKRGRPASSSKKAEAGPSVEAANDATVADPAAPATGDPAPPPVKRGRGRPKKACCGSTSRVPLALTQSLNTFHHLSIRISFRPRTKFPLFCVISTLPLPFPPSRSKQQKRLLPKRQRRIVPPQNVEGLARNPRSMKTLPPLLQSTLPLL